MNTQRDSGEKITSVMQIQARIRSRELSPIAVVSECLNRIQELNSELNAFITVLGEQALDQTKIAERNE